MRELVGLAKWNFEFLHINKFKIPAINILEKYVHLYESSEFYKNNFPYIYFDFLIVPMVFLCYRCLMNGM